MSEMAGKIRHLGDRKGRYFAQYMKQGKQKPDNGATLSCNRSSCTMV
jgi:hypothetical protein